MNTIKLEEGWAEIETCINRLIQIVWSDDLTGRKFDNREYMTVFALVYEMCTQEAPHNYAEQLYSRYKKTYNDVFMQYVVPEIDGAPDTERPRGRTPSAARPPSVEPNFNDLPSELKRLIFDKNRQAAKDERLRQNYAIQEQWSRYRIFMKWMAAFFSYLDRFHTKRLGLPHIKGRDMGATLFRDYLRDRLSEDSIDAILI